MFKSLTKKKCDEFSINPRINPLTKKRIEIGKKTYNEIKSNCETLERMNWSNEKNQTFQESKKSLNTRKSLTVDDCEEFLKNPSVNPLNKRKISEGKKVYKNLVNQCLEILPNGFISRTSHKFKPVLEETKPTKRKILNSRSFKEDSVISQSIISPSFQDPMEGTSSTYRSPTILSPKRISEKSFSDHHNSSEIPIIDFNHKIFSKLNPGFALFDYQVDVLEWMKRREEMDPEEAKGMRGGIISLTMGMGKTFTSLMHSLMNPTKFPTLIIASKTIMGEWKSQGIEKFFKPGSVKVLYLHKNYLGDKFNDISRKDILKCDLVITTYDVCNNICSKNGYYRDIESIDKSLKSKRTIINENTKKVVDRPNLIGPAVIYGTPWGRIICDESQKFSNPSTTIYRNMMALYGDYKWCLSGTPIRNSDLDIWSQMRFCGFNRVDHQINWKRLGSEYFNAQNLRSCLYILNYSDAQIKLPQKFETIEEITLSPEVYKMYAHILRKTREVLINGDKINFGVVIALLTNMRQFLISPSIVLPDKSKSKPFGIYSDKLVKALEICKNFMKKKEKGIVFSMFARGIETYAKLLDNEGIKYLHIDGSTKDRNSVLEEFKNSQDINILLMTYKIGAEGLNIISANHCIFLDPWWNNAVHNQAKARAWRTGQTKPVYIYSLICKNTLEEKILDLCIYKDHLYEKYIGDQNLAKGHLERPGITLKELLSLLDL